MADEKHTEETKAPATAPKATPSPDRVEEEPKIGKDTLKAQAEVQTDDVEIREMQSPSHAGELKTEVSKRNLDGESGDVFTKQYVVLVGEGVKPEDYDHTANIKETREFMLHMGLRPTGDVTHVKTEEHPDGVSTIFTYEAPATAAAIDNAEGDQSDYVLRQQLDAEKKDK